MKLKMKTLSTFAMLIVMVFTQPLAYACTAFMASDTRSVAAKEFLNGFVFGDAELPTEPYSP